MCVSKKVNRRRTLLGGASVLSAAIAAKPIFAGEPFSHDVSQLIEKNIGLLNKATTMGKPANGVNPHSGLVNKTSSTKFLLEFRGLALAFAAMETVAANGHPNPSTPVFFRVSDAEWKSNAARDVVPVPHIVDCHTHYLQNGGAHVAPEYSPAANGYWWFFPEAYKFEDRNDSIAVVGDAGANRHSRRVYAEIVNRAVATYSNRFGCFVTPAPYHPELTATVLDMRDMAETINRAVKVKVSSSFGWIYTNSTKEPHPPVGQSQSLLWKIYPDGQWGADGSRNWFTKTLPVWLKQMTASKKIHTLCVHWWDGDGNPADWKIEGKDSLLWLADNFPEVRFVIFHACYPYHSNLARMLSLSQTKNLYAEVGGAFANLLLGKNGSDNLANLPNPRGLPGIQEYFATLRGKEIAPGLFENDSQIVWGTDSIWHGSPVWQVEAFKRVVLTPNEWNDRAFKKKVLSENPLKAFSIVNQMFK